MTKFRITYRSGAQVVREAETAREAVGYDMNVAMVTECRESEGDADKVRKFLEE